MGIYLNQHLKLQINNKHPEEIRTLEFFQQKFNYITDSINLEKVHKQLIYYVNDDVDVNKNIAISADITFTSSCK